MPKEGRTLRKKLSHRKLTVTLSVGLPKIATLVLGLIGGIAQAINYYVVGASSQLHAIIALGIYFLISIGIPPLTGSKFQGALHLPAWANYVIGGLLGVGLLALGTVHMSFGLHAALAIVISVITALGFSAQVEPVAVR